MERLTQFVRGAVSHPQELAPRRLQPTPGSTAAWELDDRRTNLNGPGSRSSRVKLPQAPLPLSLDSRAGADDSDWGSAATAPLVGTACLEAGEWPLHQQILEFGRRAGAMGVQTIQIVPLFLLQGVHVMRDIPAEVRLAQPALPKLALNICPHLGSHPGLAGLLRQKWQTSPQPGPAQSLVVLAHGSRQPRGNDSTYALAKALGGTAAFWTMTPGLESQMIHLIQAGLSQLTILPYFLFTGRTTDAIIQATEELAERFSGINLRLLPPLGPSVDLANLVIDLALNRIPGRGQQAAVPMKRLAFRHPVRSSMVS